MDLMSNQYVESLITYCYFVILEQLIPRYVLILGKNITVQLGELKLPIDYYDFRWVSYLHLLLAIKQYKLILFCFYVYFILYTFSTSTNWTDSVLLYMFPVFFSFLASWLLVKGLWLCLWELWHFVINMLLTECHNSHNHSQSPLTSWLLKLH